jgi:hypothetical protein
MRHLPDTLTQALLADLPDSHVLVLPRMPASDADPLTAVWQAARDDAASAYEAWRDGAPTEAFAVYRAAADREDAAAAALAMRARMRRPRWYRLLGGDRRA